jgi:hypothetical protein
MTKDLLSPGFSVVVGVEEAVVDVEMEIGFTGTEVVGRAVVDVVIWLLVVVLLNGG